MKKKLIIVGLGFFLGMVFGNPQSSYAQNPTPHPILKFLNDIKYTTRFKVEYDSNILLKETDEDSDFKETVTQTLTYRLPKENYYFQLGYTGNYSYYDQESIGVLNHSANALYSYRPFDGFSIGFRNDYHWLQDNKITTTIGDQVLALGYIQNTPSFQVKYEMSPQYTFTTDAFYQMLDVKDPDNDDYIDNKRLGVRGKLEYNFTPNKNFIGYLGLSHRQIAFPQISEKSSVSRRVFVGVTEKFPTLFLITKEVGFENIDMDDENNASDNNIDFRIVMETIFSLYTKLRATFDYHTQNPSLRRQYTQYGANIATFHVSHMINPKTSIFLEYTYERQNFDSTHITAGQGQLDQKTYINHIKGTLSRKFKAWLTGDFVYDYTQRDSDFANESYTDHRFSISLTIKY